MKIAYVYEYDAANPAVQSTRPFSILRELKRRFAVVEYFPIPNLSRRLLAPKKIMYAAIGKDHHLEREWLSLKEYAWRVGLFLQRERPDIVFSPSQLVSTYLRTSAKVIYCNDAPFGGIANYYPNFSNLSGEYVALGYRQEFLSHKNADRIVYPSSWARECAIRLHDADPAKCMEQPFGANLPYSPAWPEVQEALDRREGKRELSLVMISSNWERKGGPFALAVVQELNRRGIPARLEVIGAAPRDIPGVTALGYINKWTEDGSRQFKTAMLGADFFIMPSVAEAYGMSLWEAAAHGLPMIGRATGGISSIIRDRETGLLLSADAGASVVADWIAESRSRAVYRRLGEQAFEDYRTRGNWRQFVDKVFEF
jgi:glycosyltransferase involved in cell wall biosynthesis